MKKGLAVEVQRALDGVRVIGNNAVHPGEVDLRDDRETANTLFACLNLIVQQLIAQPKEIAAFYDKLPQRAREAIEKRDSSAQTA